MSDERVPTPLDYARNDGARRPASPAAKFVAGVSLTIGTVICGVGAGVLFTICRPDYPGRLLENRDLYRSLFLLAVGTMFCWAGTRLKRPRQDAAG